MPRARPQAPTQERVTTSSQAPAGPPPLGHRLRPLKDACHAGGRGYPTHQCYSIFGGKKGAHLKCRKKCVEYFIHFETHFVKNLVKSITLFSPARVQPPKGRVFVVPTTVPPALRIEQCPVRTTPHTTHGFVRAK